MAIAHTSDISLQIGLDDNKVPETITWNAPDSGVENAKTKATMLSVWDDKTQETLRFDLWTKEMPMDQMKKFIHQNILALADTLERAGGEQELAKDLREYSLELGEKMNVLKRG
jgi:gliding motility-associated protein GldC